MEATLHFWDDNVQMIGIQADADANEEVGIGKIRKQSREGTLFVSLHEIIFEEWTIPVLVFSPKNNAQFDVDQFNGGEILQTLRSEKRFFGYYPKKTLFPKSIAVNGWVSESSLFLASFSYGTEFAIYPNPFTVAFRKDELQRKNNGFKIKDNEHLISKVHERKTKVFAKWADQTRKLYARIQSEGFVLGGTGTGIQFTPGTNLIVLPKEERAFYLAESIFPYTQVEGQRSLRKLTPDEREESVHAQREYAKEKKIFEDQLQIIKNKLAASGKHWFSLDWCKKWNDEWKVWLNPEDQKNHASGWFSLQDLSDWIENKGKIPTHSVVLQ